MGNDNFIIPEALIWSADGVPLSYLEVKTDKPAKVAKEFDTLFCSYWSDAFHELEGELGVRFEEDPNYYGNDEYSSYPAMIQVREDSFRVILWPVLIYYCYGEFCEIPFCLEALDNTIEDMQKKFPKARISGLIVFPWSDRRCGDSVCYSYGEEQDVYPIFAEILNHGVRHEDLFGNKSDGFFDFLYYLSDELVNAFEMENYDIFDFYEKYQDLLSYDVQTIIEDAMRTAGDEIETYDAIKLRWEESKAK